MKDHAHELRRYARKIAHPAGDVPAVMLAAADEIERLQGVIAGLRAVADEIETAHSRTRGRMTKPQALDLLMLLSALESWAFSTGKPLPDYLLERLDVALAVLRDEVL